MKKIKQVLSGSSNNANGRALVPPSIPTNQTVQRADNNTPRKEIDFDEAVGSSSRSGNNNLNNLFKSELIRFMREMNKRMDQNAKKFHAWMDQIMGAPPMLKRPDSKKYTHLTFNPSVT